VDVVEDMTVFRVRLKASKMDQFREGAMLFVGKRTPGLCPVKTLVRGKEAGLLFVFEDGRFLN